jgi:folate-dependent phosphoribosylglycinamide formyltransferase PurN
MKVAFIATPGRSFNKYIAGEIARHHELVALIDPASGGARSGVGFQRTIDKISAIRRKIGARGFRYFALGQAGKIGGWDYRANLDEAESQALGFTSADPPAAPVHRVSDINTRETIDFIQSLKLDAVVCHGGPIYRKPLIEASPLMLNFHSGISPLYNGASTIRFAFANGHPHLCGGTLMTMSPIVDGGDILAHYLPSIEHDDNPATLFIKTVKGAAQLFARALTHIEKNGSYARVEQTPPLFYFRSDDWTAYQSVREKSSIEKGIAKQYLREAETVEYFAAPDSSTARTLYVSKILNLLKMDGL